MQFFPVREQQQHFKGLTLLVVRVAPHTAQQLQSRGELPHARSTPRSVPCTQPAVTIGNVGQLAADLLISTAQLPLVGRLESRHVLPCFGLDAFRSGGGPSTGLELYLDAPRGVLVLQQRAPAVTGCQRRFAEELLEWTQKAGLQKVVAATRAVVSLASATWLV